MRALAALAGLLAVLVAAAPAAADSLVFIRDNNVWLANANGTGQYQVTLDGTPGSPYSSPSQADDGTIVALRTPTGGRPQIWRMRQNGGLLNPAINTPAPGSGAVDARVSPNGQLVAYWFVTEVSTGPCLYCFDISTRVLISHADRFTNPDEVGTPNTGSFPSWVSNDTLLMSGGASQWYYTLGMPEAAEWWGDAPNCNGCQPPPIVNLTDGEVSRDGQRIAIVRGNSNETIALYQASGPPPANPTPECALTGPVGGKFTRPTWSSDGHTLAWQEGNGIWSAQVPDITNCSTISPSQLIVAGATDPDLGPAPVNPGPRPGCGNPGNPTACPTSGMGTGTGSPPGSTTVLAPRLEALLARISRALKRVGLRGLLLRHQLSLAYTSPSAGTLLVTFVLTGGHPVIIGSGRVVFTAGGTRTLVLKLSLAKAQRLKHARHLTGTLKLSFSAAGVPAASKSLKVSMSR